MSKPEKPKKRRKGPPIRGEGWQARAAGKRCTFYLQEQTQAQLESLAVYEATSKSGMVTLLVEQATRAKGR